MSVLQRLLTVSLSIILLAANVGVAQPIPSDATVSVGEAAKTCMASAKAQRKNQNSAIDTRCSLVAFEVCMNKAKGIISQSQDAKRQCAMMKKIAGPNTCLQPCSDAITLPIGGNGSVGRYTGLTTAAVDCYNHSLKGILGNNEAQDACVVNNALSCLQNASAQPSVNAAILRDRKSACKSFSGSFPGETCVSCTGDGNLRVDYEELKKHDVLGVGTAPAN